MALPPKTDEAFLREVDEELRREQIGTFWMRYGRLVVVLVIAALAAFGGYLWWNAQQEKAIGLTSEKMSAALEDLNQGKVKEAQAALTALSTDKSDGYRGIARLALAAQKLDGGDVAGATAAYDAIAADTALPQPFRDLALIRSTAASFDTIKPERVIVRMKPLAVQGNPWFGSAGELTAIAWLKLNQPKKAGAIFAALAKDGQVPESIRARAVRISGALGIDAAPLPEVTVKEVK